MDLRSVFQFACVLVLILTGPAAAQQEAGRRNDRLQSALAELDLSDAQKQQLDRHFVSVRERSEAIGAMRRDDPAEARRIRREIAADTRAEIARTLTPDQQRALRQRMQRRSETAPPPPPPAPPEPTPEPTPDAPPNTPPQSSEPTTDTAPVPSRFSRAGNPLAAGSAAPPINLTDLNGRRITLDNLPRRPLVLIFGSYSCPSFRQQIPRLNQLADAHSRRADFLIVYTREAHAVGEWEVQRNRDEDIRVAQHLDIDARKSVATAARRTLGIKLPVALDDMDNTTIRHYDAFPNGTVILTADRKILAAQRWANPFLINEVLLGMGQ